MSDGSLAESSTVPKEVDDKHQSSDNTSDGVDRSMKIEKTVESSVSSEIKDEFLSPAIPAPVSKPQKKTNNKPVSMTLKSRFAIPADIYKAPKVAEFIDIPIKKKKEEKIEKDVLPEQSAKPKAPPAKLTYESPEWSLEPDDGKYSLEVLKNGSIVDTVKLSGKDRFVVGRLQDCDIKMEHPSISRYHAIFQFGAPTSSSENVELQKDGTSGFYVLDLGSTHGTIINKQTVRSKTFYRIKVGHVVKFGGSTRLFILQGPEDDEEEEAKQSATELRELNKQKIKKRKDLEKMMLGEDSSSDEDEKSNRKNAHRSTESSGVTWGMLEEAVNNSSDEEEDEEEKPGDSRADHPDAILVQTKKDPFYVKDPLKALKNLYEREKLELDFECSERRSGHWHVKLCLPVDTPNGKPIYAEMNATGKKKDTIRQCALEACRILERHGLFHRKDRHKVKLKQWENDDFYDSDEDEFHDRTGDLELKRKQRMQRAGKKLKGNKTVETYDSLVKKMNDLTAEIKDIEMKLEKDKAVTKVNTKAEDPLDAFMQQVKSGKALDTTTRSKLKRRILEARKEHMRISKLAELARPSSLPPLQNSSAKTYSFVGKMKGIKKPIISVPALPVKATPTMQTEANVMEEFDDEEDKKPPISETSVKVVKLMDKVPQTEKIVDSIPDNLAQSHTIEDNTLSKIESVPSQPDAKSPTKNIKKYELKESGNNISIPEQNVPEKRILGPTLPQELRRQLSSEPENDADNGEQVSEPKRKRRRQRKPKVIDKTAQQFSDDPKYSGWLPPEDQSGDGKISLNEKLGY